MVERAPRGHLHLWVHFLVVIPIGDSLGIRESPTGIRNLICFGGKYGVCFSSGMAAVDSIMKILHAGDHVVCSDDVYGGVSRLYNNLMINYNISFTYVLVSLYGIFSIKYNISSVEYLLGIAILSAPTNFCECK